AGKPLWHRHWRSIADSVDRQDWQSGDRTPLRMCIPLFERAEHGRDKSCISRGGFERRSLPRAERARHRLALPRTAEQPEYAVSVVRKVGVKADPAVVLAAIRACERVPHLRRRPPK